MKGLKILFLLILFIAAYSWSVGEVVQYFNGSWNYAFEYDGSAWHFRGVTAVVGIVNHTLTPEELVNYTLGDRFYLKNESLTTASLLPFIIRGETNETMKDLLLRGLALHAGQIAPKQYQVLENLTGLMNISYNSSACVSYMLYPEVFSVDMPYKYLNLTYCDFEPDTYDVPYTPSGEVKVDVRSEDVDSRVVSGYVSYDIEDVDQYSFDICYKLGYKVDGDLVITDERCRYGLGAGTYRFSGAYYKGWGPLAELEIRARLVTHCSLWYCYSYLVIDDTIPKKRSLIFKKDSHQIILNTTLYNGSFPVYVDVKPAVEFTNDYVENLVAANISFSHYTDGFVSDSYTAETLWGYEEALVNYSVFVRDKIDAYGNEVVRVYPAGYFKVHYTTDGKLPPWGETAVIRSVAEINETALPPVPVWVTESQEINVSYVKEYLNYEVYRWTAHRIRDFLEDVYGSDFEYGAYEAWFMSSLLAGQIHRDDNLTGYPYEALIAKNGSSIQIGEQVPAVSSFYTYVSAIPTDVLWYPQNMSGCEIQSGVLALTLLDVDNIDDARYPPVLKPLAKVVGDMKLMLSEMGVQKSYVVVPEFICKGEKEVSIVEMPQEGDELTLYYGWYNQSVVFDYGVQEKNVIFLKYYYSSEDLRDLQDELSSS
jgi:hypothetical protein